MTVIGGQQSHDEQCAFVVTFSKLQVGDEKYREKGKKTRFFQYHV